jgi:penicillin-binding protein 1A
MRHIFAPERDPRVRSAGRRRTFWRWFRIVGLAVLVLGTGYVVLTLHNLSKLLPDPDLADYVSPEATVLYDRKGDVIAKLYVENREFAPLKKVPEFLVEGTVAIEDRRFYRHQGIDFRGLARAAWHDLLARRVVEGGSTITQQLARNIYLSRKKSVGRKVQEAILAIQIERRYSKDEIMQLYLNEVYYGSRAYGAQAAARVYFDKDIADLTLPECALLAGLPKRPSDYSPYENIEAAKKRRNVVLKRMFDLGYVSYDEYTAAVDAKIKLAGQEPSSPVFNKAPYFASYVRRQLEEEFGPEVVYNAGLRVYTTLDIEVQKAAQKAVRTALSDPRNTRMGQGALVCLDCTNGDILAMVGGREPTIEGFNRATQAKRPPGSSFKLFVYTAATEAGIKPTDSVEDSPFTVTTPGLPPWSPHNYDHKYRGTVTLARAFAGSYNVCAARLLQRVGADAAIRWARAMGITSELRATPSLALGTSEVTVLEMANAYGVVGAGGYRVDPVGYRRVEDRRGRVLRDVRTKRVKVMDDGLAKTMRDYTRWVVTSGTGMKAGVVPGAHGKTGTTSDYRDGWFCGFADGIACAVWVGNDDFSPIRRRGGGVSGAGTALPIWRDFMLDCLKITDRVEAAKEGVHTASGPRSAQVESEQPQAGPDTGQAGGETIYVLVTICDDTGLKATPYCPSRHTEEFIRGTEPTATCTKHRGPDDEHRGGGFE